MTKGFKTAFISKGYNVGSGLISLLLIIFSGINLSYAKTPANIENKNQALMEKAVNLNLHKERYWQILLHCYPSITGIKSRIDDKRFFLAENGKNDPKSELMASIRFLFQDDPSESIKYIKRFYARYNWLKSKLDPDDHFYKRITPDEFKNLSPVSASVVFPTYYMNNPASMFGHTFLIINSGFKNKRLADSVNYAARTNTRNGINFAISGIFGFFKGYYSVIPYYKQIKQYSDINQRDMWEYRLNLNEKELERMIWHIHELDNIYTDYYFFDENCSFNLLYLIEAARPKARLVEKFKTTVIPIDTIKVMKKENIIDSVELRPSISTKIKKKLSVLPQELRKKAIEISKNPEKISLVFNNKEKTKPEREEKIAMADLASLIVQYNYISGKIDKKEYSRLLLAILKERSRLGQSDKKQIKKEVKDFKFNEKQPDLGHDSARISITSGIMENDFFTGLRFRPAFTDLGDMDYVKGKGAKIEFLDTNIQYFTESEKLSIEHLDILDIKSVTPRDDVFKPISWKVNTGFQRKRPDLKENADIFQLNTGGGVSYPLPLKDQIFYLMLEQQSFFGGAIKRSFSLGAGVDAGFIFSDYENWKLNLEARYLRFCINEFYSLYETNLSFNFRVSKNCHLEFNLNISDKERKRAETGSLSFHIFF